jgi:PEGA domain
MRVSIVSKHATTLLTLVAASVVRLQPAHAENGVLVVGGGAAEHERAVIGGAIESAIREAGWSLPSNPLTDNETRDLLHCSDSHAPWNCVLTAFGTKGVGGAFVVSVESSQAENGAPLVIITERMIATSPPLFTVRQRLCEHCADDRLGAAGELLTQQLLREFSARNGRTVVHVSSEPPGADIVLDGVHVGATDSTFNTYPAMHVVMVQKPGYASEIRNVTVEEGKTVELSVTLHPAGTSPSRQSPSGAPPSRLGPGIAIGAGAALVVFGSALVYRGEQNSSDDKYLYPHATALGAISGLVGLAALGAGLYSLRDAPNRSGPSASITSGGAIVGWAGGF